MAPKAKKPLSAKAKLKLKATKIAERAAGIASGEIVEGPPKAKVSMFKKKILATLGSKSVTEAAGEFKKRAQVKKAELQEAEAMEKAQNQQVKEAEGQYEKAKAEIAAATKNEMDSAGSYKAVVAQRSEVTHKVEEARKELYESQKKVAMLEVLAVNHAKMKALEDTRKRAQEAAESARKNMLEQKQKEKDALEATRRALAEVKNEMKAGKKRLAPGDAADTVPATAAGGAQAADID